MNTFENSVDEYLIATISAFSLVMDFLKIKDPSRRKAAIQMLAEKTGRILGEMTLAKIDKEVQAHMEKEEN